MPELNHYQELLARHDYAIIDLTGRGVADYWEEELPLKPLIPFALRHSGGILPSYVDLKALNEEQTGLLCQDLKAAEGDEFRPIISSIVSCPPRTDEDAFTAHFMNHMIMHYPEGRFVLRFWDSRAFLQLRRVIVKEQFFGLYAGIVKEWTVFFQGGWISFAAPEVESVRADWQVTNEEYAQIERILIINEALAKWKKVQPQKWQSLEEFDSVAKKLDGVLKVAEEEFKIADINDDLRNFALHALEYGYGFYRHPHIQAALQKAQKNGWGYTACIEAEMDEVKWIEVKSIPLAAQSTGKMTRQIV